MLAACSGVPQKAPPIITTKTVEVLPTPVIKHQHVPPAKPIKPAKVKITADELLGKSDAWLRKTLGNPDFARTDRYANIWQYKNKSCVLNIFLYTDENTRKTGPKTAHILHFDARDAQGRNTDREACLNALQN